MATKFPILPHYPINADDRACLSALAFVFYQRLCPFCWNAEHFCDEPVLEKSVLVSLE